MAELELPDHDELVERAKDRYTKRVALLTAVYAVLLAITSLGGNNAAKEMMLAQQQVTDQWAFYQSKAMREHLYRSQRQQLEAQLLERQDGMAKAAWENYDRLIREMSAEEGRYRDEKKGIEKGAKELEATRDRNMSKDPYFDYAEVLLQIAIVMASIAILSSSRPVLWLSVGSATAGTILTVNGFLLIFRLPFLH